MTQLIEHSSHVQRLCPHCSSPGPVLHVIPFLVTSQEEEKKLHYGCFKFT